MKLRRFGLAFVLAALALSSLTAGAAEASTGCVPAAGQLAVFESLAYGGNCATKSEGSYDTASMGVANNSIESLKIGGTDSNGFHVRLLACQDAAFVNCSGFLTSGDVPTYPDPDSNFRNTISSFRVQPYNSSNAYPSANVTYTWPDGTKFITRQCTWGAADRLKSFANIYPGWSGNALDWDTNASAHHYLVNDTPAWDSILVIDANVSSVVASGWSGAYDGGSPVNKQTWTNRTGSLGHVAWIVDVRTDSTGAIWLHTLESNVDVSRMTRSNWTVYTNSAGVQFLNIYQRWNSTDQSHMAIVHIDG
jgi:surface antigen